MVLNHHALHHICIITTFHAFYMCVYFVANLCVGRFGLGWAHDAFKFACHIFMHFSCICTFIYLYSYIELLVLFCLSPFLSFFQFASWHLNWNPLHLRTLFVPGHLPLTLPLLIFSSMMRKLVRTSRRTFPDVRNAKLFYRTSPILTYPLSSTVRVGSYCVASRSLVLPW